MKKIFVLGGIGVIIAGFGVSFVSSTAQESQEVFRESSQEKTYIVSQDSIEPVYEVAGFVRGANEASIVPKVSGYVGEFKVSEGERVVKGQILAVLEADEYASGLATASAREKLARDSAVSSSRYYDEQVSIAEGELQKAKEVRDQAKDSENHDAYEIAKKDVEIARDALDSAKRFRDMNKTVATGNTDVATAQKNEAIVWEEARFVRAPFSGVVAKKFADVGSWVSPPSPLLILSTDAKKEVAVFVDASRADALRPGLSVEGRVNEARFTGNILTVAPGIEATHQKVSVVVQLSDDADVALGSYARVMFREDAREGLVVPSSYLTKEYFDMFLFVKNGDVVEKRHVETGEKFDDKVEILSGISDGDVIVLPFE